MAVGLPVVAADGGAHRELLGPDQVPLLFAIGDVDAAAERLRGLADDGELRRRVGRTLRARQQEQFSLAAHGEALEAASVTNRAASGPGRQAWAVRRRPILVFPHAHQRGGVERIAWQALQDLAAKGPVVFVGHTVEPEIAGVVHVPVKRQGGRASAPWYFRRAVSRALVEVRSGDDVVVTFGANCPPGDVWVVNSVHRSWLRSGHSVRIRGMKVPNVLRYLLARHVVLLWLERSYFRGARGRRVVAVSAEVAGDLAGLYHVPVERTVVIPNGFAGEQCSPERRVALRTEQRAAWGIQDDSIALLFVANELHRKGFDCLIEAVAVRATRGSRSTWSGEPPSTRMFPGSRSSAWAAACTTTAPSTSDSRTPPPTHWCCRRSTKRSHSLSSRRWPPGFRWSRRPYPGQGISFATV